MKQFLVYFLVLICLLFSSCYPTYVASSGKVLPKGDASLNINAFIPIVNPSFAVRYGIGNKNELHVQSSILSHEIGLRHALLDTNSLFQSSIGLTAGMGNISYGTGEYEDVPSSWDPTDTMSNEIEANVRLALLRAPFIFSIGDRNNKTQFFGHIAPTMALNNSQKEFGISMSLGINMKISNTIGLCISPYLHAPLGLSQNEGYFLGYPRVNFLPIYNYGVMLGVHIGQF